VNRYGSGSAAWSGSRGRYSDGRRACSLPAESFPFRDADLERALHRPGIFDGLFHPARVRSRNRSARSSKTVRPPFASSVLKCGESVCGRGRWDRDRTAAAQSLEELADRLLQTPSRIEDKYGSQNRDAVYSPLSRVSTCRPTLISQSTPCARPMSQFCEKIRVSPFHRVRSGAFPRTPTDPAPWRPLARAAVPGGLRYRTGPAGPVRTCSLRPR
jgi:hypothetical protein